MVLTKKLGVLLAAAMVVVMLAIGTPAYAAKGGNPNEASCGLGRDLAQAGIANQAGPGASEEARVPPASIGCTG